MFQALGNTLPSLLSIAARLVAYVLPTMWLATQPGYKLEHVWYLSIVSMGVQAAISFALLRRQMRLQLGSSRMSDLGKIIAAPHRNVTHSAGWVSATYISVIQCDYTHPRSICEERTYFLR